MRIDQYMYTSWGASGYNVFARSDGITDQMLPALAANTRYQTPTGLPDTSDFDEIMQLYPLNFTNFLVDGKNVIARVNYLGQDDSGRYGNYFVHALCFSEAADFYPVDLAYETFWKTRLTPEERQMDRGPHRADVLWEIPHGTGVSWDDLSAFVDEEGEDKFHALIHGYVLAKKTNRRLVLYDQKEKLPMWLALLTHSFPLETAKNITFSTYVWDFTKSSVDIISIPREGTPFNYDMEIKNGRMVVLDMERGLYTEGMEAFRITDFLAMSWAYSEESLEEWKDFLSQAGAAASDWNHFGALGELFMALRGEEPEGSWKELIDLADRLNQEAVSGKMCDFLMEKIESPEGGFNTEEMTAALAFLQKHESLRRSSVCAAVNDFIASRFEGTSDEELLRIEQALLSGAAGQEALCYAAESTVMEDNLQMLAGKSGMAYDRAACYFLEAFRAAGRGRDPEAMQCVMQTLAQGTHSTEQLARAAGRLLSDPPTYAALVALVCRAGSVADGVDLVNRARAGIGKETADALYTALVGRPDTVQVALRLIFQGTASEKEKKESFWKLYNALFSTGENRQMQGLFLREYVSHVSRDHAVQEVGEILKKLPLQSMQPETLSEVAGLLDRAEYAELVDSDHRITEQVLGACEQMRIGTLSGSLAIYAQTVLLGRMRESGRKFSDAARNCNLYCDYLDEKGYKALMGQVMPMIAPWLRDDEDFLAMGQLTLRSRSTDAMADAYVDELHDMAKHMKRHIDALVCPLAYMVHHTYSPAPIQALEKPLIGFFAKMNENELNELLRAGRMMNATPETNSFLREIKTKKENSFGNKLRNLFGGRK